MARFHFRFLHFFVFLFYAAYVSASRSSFESDFSIIDSDSEGLLFHRDYSPPAPPPPPPHAPSVSCTDDLGGVGSLDSTCQIVADLNLTRDVYIQGKGNFYILPGVRFHCPILGCSITVNISGNFSLGENSTVVTGTFQLAAYNASFFDGSAVNTTGWAGNPPPQTSGTPQGVEGAGGGHGGRGACCLVDDRKLPEDIWGGDAYSWSSLQEPCSYGSKGGTTSKEVDYGGGGGGWVKMEIKELLEVNGSLLADGGDGGTKGGGGSGGSIYIKSHKMTGSGRISACGGDGFGGGGGGRVSVNIFSRHDEPKIYVHGGTSRGCLENAGAAGTLYDAVPRSLTVNNNNLSTDTDTLLLEFPYQPLWTNVYIQNRARASVPLLWSRVQVQGQISLLSGGMLSFGLAHYASSEFELLAEELLMSDSIIEVYGALRMTVKIFLMWNSKMVIDGGEDTTVATSWLEASNLVVLKESSVVHSNANLGVRGQGLLNLSGPGDTIQAQRLVLSLFYSIHVGPGSVLRGPLETASPDAVTPRLYCELQDCPTELLHPPEDCNVNSSLPFTLQICRVEDITVEGLIKGSVVHFHWARTISVQSSGVISASGMGCVGGAGRGNFLDNGIGSGSGHGGKGGLACYNGSCVEGGISYGNSELPCELGSGSGNESSADSSAGGGVIVMGSMEHPLPSLSVEGAVRADGESFEETVWQQEYSVSNGSSIAPGGGSGGTVLLFLQKLTLGKSASLSSVGGYGSSKGGGGGGGGRIHFHWSNIPTGDVYQPIASVKGNIYARGGLGRDQSGGGENGTVTGKTCPKGLYGTFCAECPVGTYKNVSGSDSSLCRPCPASQLPRRAVYVYVRGGVAETPCPFECISDRYHMPHCFTALEELIYTFGGPWLFGLLLLGLLILLALVLSVARMKFVGVDELPGPAPTQHGSQRDHSFPFLESLNEVLETNRVEESQSHVHRMYFMGPNTFSEPWHLPHTPPEEIKEIVYEGAYNTFVDEINAIAAYQWWEGAIYTILSLLVYPLALSWQQWRRRMRLQRLREFVRSEYDHACLRSCRSRALYEGLKVSATTDLMLAYVDFFLGGDEKRTDLPPRLPQRFPMAMIFGGDGSYMAPFSLQIDNVLTSLMSQLVAPTTWYRLVAGLNAQLRLVRRGRLRATFRPVLRWLETHANPALRIHGVRIDLAWFQATPGNYRQYGLLVYSVEEENEPICLGNTNGGVKTETFSRVKTTDMPNESGSPRQDVPLTQGHQSSEGFARRKRSYRGLIDANSLQKLEEKRDIFYLLSFILHNTKPGGHQDLVGLVISMLLLGDFSLVLLTFLQLYSISLVDVFLVLFILPLGILLPFPAGINALFSHGPRRSAGRIAGNEFVLPGLGNEIVLSGKNGMLGVAFLCGYVHYHHQLSSSKTIPNLQPWNINMDESEWWIFPVGLVMCKLFQSQLINWHIANLEIQDRSLYSNDFELYWQS
ncbi:1-aminocyclopropane-1-carboxylate deaminase [Gossypium australe]|uniref:1-aminocyclopropane-1-carboxylate deaminase n=1 Tax=Gossypium australe TaxID=47621 RepID=A0A5B6W8Q2_9ROSI|nr:1-aminocyclopropane-1-carboxylate deaminase [Gossypium australe]